MPGRNDPCHCGSGKKYKKCCLDNDEKSTEDTRSAACPSYVIDRDIPGLIALFEERSGKEFTAAQVRTIEPDCIQPLVDLHGTDPDFCEYIRSVVLEASVAQMARDGAAQRFASRLTPVQVRYLNELANNFLRVWLIREVHPGVGLTLQDLYTSEIVKIREESGSTQLVPMQLVVGRVISDHTHLTISNCFLTTQQDVDSLQKKWNRKPPSIRQLAPTSTGNPSLARSMAVEWEIALVSDFVRRCVCPKPILMMDVGSNAPMEMVHDRFTVLDQASFIARLKAREDIDPSPHEKNHWIRFVEMDEVQVRILAHLVLKEDVLTMTSRSQVAGKTNRAWLKEFVGDTLRFRSRKIEPFETLTGRRSQESYSVKPPVAIPREAVEQLYRSTYRTWADSPLPAFDNKTPRAKARTRSGEAEVIAMVRSYQASENSMARTQERAPVDFSWLLQDAGIDPRKM